MAQLSPADIQRIYAKNDQKLNLEQAEEVLNLLRTFAEIAVSQTLRSEQQISTESLLSSDECDPKKLNHHSY